MQTCLKPRFFFFVTLACVMGLIFGQAQAQTESSSASGTAVTTMINVSAASYVASGELAAESVVAGFGTGLAQTTEVAASVPLPTQLGGVSIKVTDSQGVERFAPLFFVSPNQINYQIPPGTALGTVSMAVMNNNTILIANGSARILRVVPSLFAANSNGQGLPAALALRVRGDGSVNYELVAQYDASQGRFVPVPIDLGPATDQVFLVLYGTGFKYRNDLKSVTALTGGMNCEVLYAGVAPGFIGLDQINMRLPRQLAGRGEVDLTLNAEVRTSNTLRVVVR